MAFPTIETTNSGSTAASTSHVINMPSGISVGDLLLCFFSTDGDNTITNWGGFTNLGQQSNGTAAFFAIGYKIAVGSDTLTITTSVSEPGAHVTYRISGHGSASQIPELSTVAQSASNLPDPTSLTPTGGAKDYLWIHACGWDRNRTVSAWNANFTLNQLYASGGASSSSSVGISGRNENVVSKDPTYITLSASDQWIAWTVAVHPAAGFSEAVASRQVTRTVQRDSRDSRQVTRTIQRDGRDSRQISRSVVLIGVDSKQVTRLVQLDGRASEQISRNVQRDGEDSRQVTRLVQRDGQDSRQITRTVTLTDIDSYADLTETAGSTVTDTVHS